MRNLNCNYYGQFKLGKKNLPNKNNKKFTSQPLQIYYIDFLQIKHWQSIQLKIIDQIRLIFVYTVMQ